MSLDVGFVRSVDWAAPPGWGFGEALQVHLAGEEPLMSLKEIKEVYAEFAANSDDSNAAAKDARDFVSWCEGYWTERGLTEDTEIRLVFWA